MSPRIGELNWRLDDLVNRLPGADRAVLLSADGLMMCRSAGLSEEDGDHHHSRVRQELADGHLGEER